MRNLAPALVLLLACGDKKPGPDAEILPRCSTPVPGKTVEMKLVGQVANAALLVTAPPNDPRLFVIEQTGAIRIFENEILLPAPFLDLSADASGPVIGTNESENGLLGLAFHPRYAQNGTYFVTYTARLSGDPANPQRDVLARCQVSATDPNKSEASSCVEVLSIPDYAANHNGGMIEFGKDGFLYWATGDGGSANDPNNNGQALVDGTPNANTKALLAKMLRLDIDNKSPGKEYGIPADNPFASGGGAPEIFMIGLRNAWRWTFDRMTGDMWIADVGQGAIEEITVLRPAQQKGANLGWSVFEASACFKPPCTITAKMPQDERLHSNGFLSITGGQVYRGTCYPDIVGTYYYTDFVKGGLYSATLNADDTLTVVDLVGSFPGKGAAIHEDARGELYLSDTRGNIFQLQVTGP
ncbi:MAG: PQQ-dependent sugar dehydrogenase [Kofleriaceae bacterium]